MAFSDVTSTAGGMISDLKSRLGFARNDEEYDDYDEEYDDYEDEYDDFDEYEDDYSSRPARGEVGGFRPATTRSSRFGRADSAADNLVSLEDVRANTTYTEGLSRGTSSSDETPGMRRTIGGRNLVENTGPAESSPAYNAAMRERERQQDQASSRETRPRTGGVDSLFQPSTGATGAGTGTGTGTSYDPYVAYSSSTPSAYSTTRGLTVIRPVAYGDVERIARAVKAGDVVVLAMRNTPQDLQKRVLDFSFGVAAALDANVECPAEKVFAIARGRELSEEEKSSLRTQGVL